MGERTIAVLSGKGGAGKTFVSVNLASVFQNAVYADCDVEEPNGRLYWQPQKTESRQVSVPVPVADGSLCNGCRTCTEFCQYSALAYVRNRVKVFENLCHSCGGCSLLCPSKAISERDRRIGEIETGISEETTVLTGILDTGMATGVPIIKELIKSVKRYKNVPKVIDCPPGNACTVMESIRDADYCLLVAEPTIFGAHNLEMAYRLADLFRKPFGVLLNKSLDSENPSESFCLKNGIPIVGKIPFDKRIGEANAKGVIIARESERYRRLFAEIIGNIGDVGRI